MVRKVLVSLGSILGHAQLRKQVGHNAVRDLRRQRGRNKANAVKREKEKLEIGKHIPSPTEVAAILAHAKGHWRPLLVTAAFTGLRASELRGLRWSDVDLKKHELHVRQRADRYNIIGLPKADASKRVVPFGKVVANTLKEWKLQCPHGELVFPNGKGKVEYHTHIVNRGFIPAQIAAGVSNQGRQGQIHRPARAPAFLRELVHQQPRRRRSRLTSQVRAGATRALFDHYDV